MTTVPRPHVGVAVPRPRPRVLERVGETATGLALLAILVLALLPKGFAIGPETLSVGVYGPRGEWVRVVLFVFGLGAYAMAAAFAMRLGGRAGRFTAAMCAVWATASTVDAFIATSPPHEHSLHGLVHIVIAITGLLAQIAIAGVFPLLVRRRLGALPLPTLATSLLVVAAAAFFAAFRVTEVGLGERFLFLASAVWMTVNVRVAARARRSGRMAAREHADRTPAAVD